MKENLMWPIIYAFLPAPLWKRLDFLILKCVNRQMGDGGLYHVTHFG